jgi:spermidine/putrescine transport system ATP-binding protein
VVISVRPEKIQVGATASTEAINAYEGTLKHVMYLGTHVHYVVELLTGDRLTVLQPNRSEALPLHAPVQVYWSAKDCLALTA